MVVPIPMDLSNAKFLLKPTDFTGYVENGFLWLCDCTWRVKIRVAVRIATAVSAMGLDTDGVGCEVECARIYIASTRTDRPRSMRRNLQIAGRILQ